MPALPHRAHRCAARACFTTILPLMMLILAGACQFPVQVSVQTPHLADVDSGRMAGHPQVNPPALAAVAAGATPVQRTPSVMATPTRQPALVPAGSAPDRIVAAAIGLDAPVVETGWVTSPQGEPVWQTPENAAGFHHGSALPGCPGNTVLSGHHNIKGEVFANLWQLAPGDAVTLYADGRAYRYLVEDSFIVREDGATAAQREQNGRWIAPTRDERLTLVTCWPPQDNSHRVIVIARPTDGQKEVRVP